MGTPPIRDDIRTPSPEQLRQAPAYSPVRPAVTPLQVAGFDPVQEEPFANPSRCVTSYQLKNVSVFTGRDKQGPRIEDWVRDMRYLLQVKGPAAPQVAFNEIVRHTGGRARDLLLNLEERDSEVPSANAVFKELLEEYGELDLTVSPMAAFYARLQMPNESPSDYAIALEALLRRATTYGARAQDSQRDGTLTTQFMLGLRDRAVKSRLAPMRPRDMTFKDLRRELQVINEEVRQMRGAERATVFEQSEVRAPRKEQTDKTTDLLESLRTQLAPNAAHPTAAAGNHPPPNGWADPAWQPARECGEQPSGPAKWPSPKTWPTTLLRLWTTGAHFPSMPCTHQLPNAPTTPTPEP